MSAIPMYANKQDKEKALPGLYIGLFHGFKSEEDRQTAGNWGEYGPLIGPLVYMHTTYADDIKLKFVTQEAASVYGMNVEDNLCVDKNDCIPFKGIQYGDWSVFTLPLIE